MRAGETGISLKAPELGLGGARGCFTRFGFAFAFDLAAAVVDLERQAAAAPAALVAVAAGGFFFGAAAAVPAEEDDDGEGLVAALAASNKTLVPLKTLAVDITLRFET